MPAPGGVVTYTSSSDFYKVEEKEAMSLKKLIKTFDQKYLVKYKNKKGNNQEKIITNGKHSDYNSTIFNSFGQYRDDFFRNPIEEVVSLGTTTVKFMNVRNVKCFLIIIIMNTKVNRLLGIYAVINHHNN